MTLPAFQIPTLETERLRLRGHRLDDFEPLAAMWGDERVTQHIGGKPSPREQSWRRLLAYVGHWALLGYGLWAVESKESGEFIGEVGFADFKRDIEPKMKYPEAGWVFAPHAFGKGYATEALQKALTWSSTHMQTSTISCLIGIENKASLRVAEKCRFQKISEIVYHEDRVQLFERHF